MAVRRGFQNQVLVLLLGLGIGLGTTGCLQDQVSDQGTVVDIAPDQAPDPDSFVCNPLADGGANHSRNQGVHGELFYVPAGGPHYSNAADYIANATRVDVNLFFNQIFVPTRPFDRGFVTASGLTLMNDQGTTLYEWFAIRFRGQLQLGLGQEPGRFQMALLSDDGSVLKVGREGAETELVNNDGWTPTRLRCATAPIELTETETVPFVLDYFQGPRYHIAVTLLWRRWPADEAEVNDPLCGRSGNSFWFDSTQSPPQPTANYNALLSRGWQPVAPDNLRLPQAAEENPCNEPAPVLSGVAVEMITRSGVTVRWVTDRPSTSQVQLTEVATSEVTLTPEDSARVIAHTVSLTGLKANTQYRLKAISKSASGRSAESAEVTFRTAR